MSWSFAAKGTKAEVFAKIEEFRPPPPDGNVEQAKNVLALAKEQIEKSADSYNGKPRIFDISAWGHVDDPQWGGTGRNFQITMKWEEQKQP